MDSWIAVRGRGSTGFSTMDRGQGAGEVLRVQHHGQRTCRGFGSMDSGQGTGCVRDSAPWTAAALGEWDRETGWENGMGWGGIPWDEVVVMAMFWWWSAGDGVVVVMAARKCLWWWS